MATPLHETKKLKSIDGHREGVTQCPIVEEEPNADVARFSNFLKDSDEPLWDGCTNYNKLSVLA